MKIQNYAVAMNAQYFNLQMKSTEAKISDTTENFKNESSQISQISLNEDNNKLINNELSRELTKAILKNISNETQSLVGDKVEITTEYVEAESLNYQVQAFVQTDDKEIELSLNVSLSRTFLQTTNIIAELPKNLLDPLVISLDGTMPSLSTNTFSFDIDSDGNNDQISRLNSGNGFLALDKNENGSIDNGNELFGTKSGDGFADLQIYDDDKNGWIDENDKIFNKLRIWQKTDGKDTLVGLGEVGIGAIFLGNTQTQFSLKSHTNELLGEVRTSSFVLFENNKAGVISQLDLAIKDETKKDINIFNKLQKDILITDQNNIYESNQNKTTENTERTESTDDKITKLKNKISRLEAKLSHVSDAQVPGIQAQIGQLYSQIMALLEVN